MEQQPRRNTGAGHGPHLRAISEHRNTFWQTIGNYGTAKSWGLKYRIIRANHRCHVSPAAGKIGTPSERAVRKATRD